MLLLLLLPVTSAFLAAFSYATPSSKPALLSSYSAQALSYSSPSYKAPKRYTAPHSGSSCPRYTNTEQETDENKRMTDAVSEEEEVKDEELIMR